MRAEPIADVAPCASRCPLFLCIQGYARPHRRGRIRRGGGVTSPSAHHCQKLCAAYVTVRASRPASATVWTNLSQSTILKRFARRVGTTGAPGTAHAALRTIARPPRRRSRRRPFGVGGGSRPDHARLRSHPVRRRRRTGRRPEARHPRVPAACRGACSRHHARARTRGSAS